LLLNHFKRKIGVIASARNGFSFSSPFQRRQYAADIRNNPLDRHAYFAFEFYLSRYTQDILASSRSNKTFPFRKEEKAMKQFSDWLAEVIENILVALWLIDHPWDG